MEAAFDYPAYLGLLALIPLLWWGGFRSLAGLGGMRRWAALGVRTVVLAMIVLALAQMQLVKKTDRLAVMYLLDQSQSVPEPQRQAMVEYVKAEVERHRNGSKEDLAGVIIFAKTAAIELPAMAENLPLATSPETIVDPQYTDLAQALQLAQAAFPPDTAKRIVIVSDGNENLGNAMEQARALAANGVGIDVVPIRAPQHGEVLVEKVTAPNNVQRGQPFDLRVVANNLPDAAQGTATPVPGRLKVYRRTKDREVVIADNEVTIEPGKRVFTVREKIDAADFYTYDARFVADNPADDGSPQNNQATAFTHVRGQGQVLLIEDYENRGEFDSVVDLLRRANLQVTAIATNELFDSLADLQPYDCVILANVPREAFSEEQVKLLVSNTEQMGSGLIMLGGPNSFGAGGWANSALEAAMPVDFQIKSAKVVPTGALALVIDRSGSMDGEKLVMARAAASAAADVLSPRDYLSVTAFDSEAYAIVPMMRAERRSTIKGRIARISSGGGTFLEPGLRMARHSLNQAADAAIRHILVLSDGQTGGTGYEAMASGYRREGITLSTVAVGADADRQLLQRMAVAGGGKFYHATNPKVLPRIFQKEARLVSRPLVYEDKSGMTPSVRFPHEMLEGLDGGFPPITGYVLTQVKHSPLVEVALVAPKPAGVDNRTLLASWTFGLGKAVAFTSDVGRRWTKRWSQWPEQERLFAQMVRWSMRPVGSQENFAVSTSIHDNRAEVILDALDKDQQFLNFLTVGARVVGPDLKPVDLEIRQVAPGRYRGEFAAETAGSYFVTLVPGVGAAPLIAGVNVGYSREFLDRGTNDPLLAELAALKPDGGKPGQLIEPTDQTGLAAFLPHSTQSTESLLTFDTFRRTLAPFRAIEDIWPYLILLAVVLFFADVFVRRVRWDLAWVPAYTMALVNRLRGRKLAPAAVTLDRLKTRKAEVAGSIEQLRTAARFEPVADAAMPLEDLAAGVRSPGTPPAQAVPTLTPSTADADESYTGRLLKAKRKVWDQPNR